MVQPTPNSRNTLLGINYSVYLGSTWYRLLYQVVLGNKNTTRMVTLPYSHEDVTDLVYHQKGLKSSMFQFTKAAIFRKYTTQGYFAAEIGDFNLYARPIPK